MKRSGWLRRFTALRSKARMRVRNPERSAAKFVRNFLSVDYVVFTKTRLCTFCGGAPCVTAHMSARGMGGCGGDWLRTIPVCLDCDAKWERGRETFLEAIGWSWQDVEAAITRHHGAWIDYAEGIT